MISLDDLRELCREKGTNIKQMEKDLGMGNGVISRWYKRGTSPSYARLSQIAEYLEVPIETITGEGREAPEDPELDEYLEELRSRSEMRMLFKLAKGATKEDVEQAVRIIEAIRNKP